MSLGDTMYYDSKTQDVCIVAVAGWLAIITAFLIVYIFDSTHNLLELLLLLPGAILNLVAGILNLVTYANANENSRTTNTLILFIMCLAAGCIMLADFILRCIKK